MKKHLIAILGGDIIGSEAKNFNVGGNAPDRRVFYTLMTGSARNRRKLITPGILRCFFSSQSPNFTKILRLPFNPLKKERKMTTTKQGEIRPQNPNTINLNQPIADIPHYERFERGTFDDLGYRMDGKTKQQFEKDLASYNEHRKEAE
jgi:hypothetical protein